MRLALVSAVLLVGVATCVSSEEEGADPGPTRVLFIDETPRWEYRYLSRVLVRDPAFDVHLWLTTADEAFPQGHSLGSGDPEFQAPLRELPRTMEALLRYDVVILGNVGPMSLPKEFPALLKEFVEERGRGLVVIAGEGRMPWGWQESALAKTLPVKALEGPIGEPREEAYRLTEAGKASPLMAGDWKERPAAGWCVATEAANGGTVLMESDDVPLFVTGTPGKGRVFFSATDGTWRWRKGLGDEPTYGAFWKTVMAWAVGE